MRGEGAASLIAWLFVPELRALPVVLTALFFVSPVGQTFANQIGEALPPRYWRTLL